MLFDRDVDGVLSLAECSTALYTLGYRLSGSNTWVTFVFRNVRNSFRKRITWTSQQCYRRWIKSDCRIQWISNDDELFCGQGSFENG